MILPICLLNTLLVPLLLSGVIRKVKALMQTRRGAPVIQPFYDIFRLLRKSETISETASWVFIWAPRIGLVIAWTVAVLVPWSGVSTRLAGATHFILVLYLMALGRFVSMLAAMDTGSSFGGLGASREATISLMVEPAMVVGLGALAIVAGSPELSVIYASPMHSIVSALVGAALLVAALAELSRMPVDDPTTHLELTMVHEAMILENSGRNLALVELAVALRTCVLLGLAAQTFLHAVPSYVDLPLLSRYALGLITLFGVGALVAVTEGVLVKLKWRSVPNFLVYAVGLSLLAALLAVRNG